MFGKNQFGKKLFAASNVLAEYIPTEEFAFNTYGLQNTTQYGIHISDFEIITPDRDFRTASVPGGHGLILLEDYFRTNGIKLRGWVSEVTREQVENKIHEFMRNVHTRGGTLYIKDGGTYKELQTTLQKATFDNPHYAITKKKFILDFAGIKSFWRDKDYTSEFYEAQTSLVLNGNMNNAGSVESDPVVIMIFDSATGITGVQFENTTTGETVSISETISSGNVLIFDAENKTATLDGVEVEFSGRFPSLQVGINSFTITLTGTSAIYDVTAKHKNQYLTP